MYECNQIGERTYYVNCPSKIGIYRSGERDVYLIDSGNDRDAGKKVKRIIEENGWKLKGIINTHSHADHIGGNRYLQQQTGCKIFANGIEAAFTRHTILEPSFLYAGFPCKDLKHKFLLAQESEVCDFTDSDFPKELEGISLAGHCFHMMGIRTPDDIVFLADCVSSRSTLEKYRIPFIYDVEGYLNTLDAAENMRAAKFVPAHAEVTDDIQELVRFNRETVYEIENKILSVLKEAKNFERILKSIFDDYKLTMNFEQYVLVGTTVRSFLSYMKDKGKIDVQFEDNMLLWKSAGR